MMAVMFKSDTVDLVTRELPEKWRSLAEDASFVMAETSDTCCNANSE
jgi:hypothetical protein